MDALQTPEEIDRLFRWPFGKAERLARRGRLPHYLLPDGKTVRFKLVEVEAQVRHFNPGATEDRPAEGGR
jgi:hypothetical protein